MAEAFTVFEKFGDVCATLNESDRKELIYAINMYGMFGEDVELAYPLNALFAALKDDIDHSKESRKKGSRGGRPKAGEQVSETEKPGVFESKNPNAKQVSETEKPGVSETEKPGVSEDSEKVETQYKTIQSNTKQSKTREKPPYPLACLAILNEELKTAYGMLPPKAGTYLQSMQDRYSLDEVRAMVAYKRDEWKGTKFELNLTPNTLFSAEHFEQYIHQSKAERGNRNAASSRSFDEEFLGKALSSV